MRKFLAKYLSHLLLLITVSFCAIGIKIVYADKPNDIPPPKQNYNEETRCVEPVETMRKQHFEFVLNQQHSCEYRRFHRCCEQSCCQGFTDQ